MLKQTVVLCEGGFDMLAIKRNAIPLLGKSITPKLMKKLVESKIQYTGGMQHVNLVLDTLSDVTTCLRAYLTDIKPIVPDEVNGIGGFSIFAEEGALHVYIQRTKRVYHSSTGSSSSAAPVTFRMRGSLGSYRHARFGNSH